MNRTLLLLVCYFIPLPLIMCYFAKYIDIPPSSKIAHNSAGERDEIAEIVCYW